MVAGARAQVTITARGPVEGFALATSVGASCVNPPGPCGTLMSLPIDLKADSLLTITFTARGVVQQPSAAIVETAIECEFDGKPCDPDGSGGLVFLYPAFCCDTRSFMWIASASKGTHTVNIKWTTDTNGTSNIQNRTLNVLAIAK